MILDGKNISSQIKEELKKELLDIKNKTGLVPGFAIIMVGENPA